MTFTPYPEEILPDDGYTDNGTMPENVAQLREAVVGHRIVAAGNKRVKSRWYGEEEAFVLTLDDGTEVSLANTSDCCAYTDLNNFFLDPAAVDHVIMGVGTTDGYTTWHVYADWGDILRLDVGWSAGNPFYYGYGFDIQVHYPQEPVHDDADPDA